MSEAQAGVVKIGDYVSSGEPPYNVHRVDFLYPNGATFQIGTTWVNGVYGELSLEDCVVLDPVEGKREWSSQRKHWREHSPLAKELSRWR
jgi:hypothetical protein